MCSNMGTGSTGSKKAASDIQAQINRLKAENVSLMQRDYTGRKNWSSQLQSAVNKAASNNKKIEKLENQIKKTSSGNAKLKTETKTTTAPVWKRAGEGWYIGEKGHEIRENYDKGGYDIVKVSGSSEKLIKHFSKLKDARTYKV